MHRARALAVLVPLTLVPVLAPATTTAARAQEPAATPTPAPVPAAGVTANAKDGFSLRSSDGAFVLRIRGYVQADGRFFTSDAQDRLADTFTVVRARPILEATIGKRLAARLMPDFGNGATSLQDGYGEWTFTPALVLRAGKYKPPVGLERLQSDTDLAFTERALPTALVPNRDVGVQLGGALGGGRVEYAAGVFDGVPDGGSTDGDSNDDKDLAARLFLSPWKETSSALGGLSFGVGASYGKQRGTTAAPALATYRTSSQQTFFAFTGDGTIGGTAIADGRRTRIAPQASFYAGPIGVLAEGVRSTQEVARGATAATIGARAWQVTGIWVLTGDPVGYRWVVPQHPFDPDAADPAARGWGSVAVVARYHTLRTDDDAFPTFAAASAVQEARAWAVGVDWTLQHWCRLMLDYEVTAFSGRGARRDSERALLGRFQVGF